MNRSRVTGDLASHGNIFVDIANDRVGIGSTIPGQKLSLPDNAKIALGNSADLQISHDGSHSIIQNTTGLLVLQDTSGLYLRTDDLRFQSDGGSETYATLTKNGAVSLNFDNNNRFQTKDYGVEVIGTTDTDGLVVSGVSTLSSSVLIGTTTEGTVDSDDLTIATSGNTGMTIRSGTTHNGAIHFSDATSGVGEYAGFIDYDHNTNLFTMGTNSARFLSADSDLVVSIGKPNFGGASRVIAYGGAGGIDKNSLSVLNPTASVSGRGAGVAVGGNTDIFGSFYGQKAGNADSAGGNVFLESVGDINFTGGGDMTTFSPPTTQVIIKSDGKFGVGTNSPGSLFQVGTDTSGKLTFDGANTLAITGPEGGAARIDFIADQGDDAADKWRIANTSGNLFKIQRTTSHTDAVSIDTSGNITFSANSNVNGALRVNTNRTLSTQFHVVGGTGSGTAYDAAVFAGGQNSTSGSGVKLHLTGCENDPLNRGVVLEGIMTDNSNAHRFSVKVSASSAAPQERLRIDASGNVMIKGYTFYGSGTGNLQVHDSTLILSKTGTGTRNWRFVNNNVSAGNLGLQCSTTDNGGTTYGNMIEITKAGQVGINEGSPDRELVVRGSSNSTIKIKAANTHTSQIFFSDTDAENPARISLFHGTGQSTSGHLLFDVGGNTVLTLKSDQNILHTKASSNPNFTLSRNASIGSDNQTIGVIDFASNTAHTVQARVMAKNHGTNNVGGLLAFETRVEGGSLTEKVRITGGGGTIISNAGTFPTSTSETLFLQGEGHNGHGTSNTRSVISITGAVTSNTNSMGIWIGARTNENTAVIGTRTSTGNLAVETYNSGWAERFRIRSDGKVVLSSSSGKMLDLQTLAGTGNCWVQLSDSSGNQKGYFGYGSSSSEKLYIVQQESASIVIYIGSGEKWYFNTSGHFVPAANDAYDIGESTNVVRNIYTGDLHLNNLSKEKGNDVDGTNGSWTIQEGQDDLYIINKLNGKKYRIPLEEVN